MLRQLKSLRSRGTRPRFPGRFVSPQLSPRFCEHDFAFAPVWLFPKIVCLNPKPQPKCPIWRCYHVLLWPNRVLGFRVWGNPSQRVLKVTRVVWSSSIQARAGFFHQSALNLPYLPTTQPIPRHPKPKALHLKALKSKP